MSNVIYGTLTANKSNGLGKWVLVNPALKSAGFFLYIYAMENHYNAITFEDIQNALNKMYKATNKLKYEGRCYLAFVSVIWADKKTVHVLRGDYSINGKPVLLLQLGGTVHKNILEAEKEYGIHLDRITQEMAQKLYQKLPIDYIDEDGKPFELKLEPPTISPVDEPLFNPIRYLLK